MVKDHRLNTMKMMDRTIKKRDVLMDFAAGHTKECFNRHDRKAHPVAWEVQRQCQTGNAFQCGTVAYILGHWALAAGVITSLPTVQEMRASVSGTVDVGVQLPDEEEYLAESFIRRVTSRGSDIRLDSGRQSAQGSNCSIPCVQRHVSSFAFLRPPHHPTVQTRFISKVKTYMYISI